MTHRSFIGQYYLGPEMSKNPPFVIHDARKKSDGRHVVVKMLGKLGYPAAELIQLQKELKFWRLVSHARIVEVTDIFDEESFIYILYDYPEGGDLEAMIIDNSCAFTEGFSRAIASTVIDALSYLHSNGIVHGGCLPANIVFYSHRGSPGWVETAKLSFLRVDISRLSSIFTDLRQLAFTLCSIMRRQPGMLSESQFHPSILKSKEWTHLTLEFVDFIEQLWNCESTLKSADNFIFHPWMTRAVSMGKGTLSSGYLPPPLLPLRPKSKIDNGMDTSNEKNSRFSTGKIRFSTRNGRKQEVDFKHGKLLLKWSHRKKISLKRWKRVFVNIDGHYLTFPHSSNPKLSMEEKSVEYAKGKYNYMLQISDNMTHRILLWIRFESEVRNNHNIIFSMHSRIYCIVLYVMFSD